MLHYLLINTVNHFEYQKTAINILTYFFCDLLFIHNYYRMTITFYDLDAAGIHSFMDLDQGVNSCLLLYSNIAVLSSWLSLEADYVYFLEEGFLI